MCPISLTVQDQYQGRRAVVEEDLTHAILGSLSADPDTISELQAAVTRFVHPRIAHELFATWSPSDGPDPDATPYCAIDLTARLIATSWQHELEDGVAATPYLDGQGPSGRWYAYHLSDTWLLTNDLRFWPTLVQQRRQDRLEQPRIDRRQILYGTPLLEFLVRQVRARFQPQEHPLITLADTTETLEDIHSSQNPAYQEARRIHARWLTQPQRSLQGRSVRDEMLAERVHIARDIEHRSHQWVSMGQCPPGLSESDSAYRWGGLGTHEIILYYDLVRYLLYHCLHRFVQGAAGNDDAEVRWLEELRDQWLNHPQPESTGSPSPREMIERERRRLPLVEDAGPALDCDCPLCRMMIDSGTGPAFTYLGGFHLDEDFAFSFCHTQEDWQLECGEFPVRSEQPEEPAADTDGFTTSF